MGVEVDKQKAKHYYELAAMAGDVNARHSLGRVEALEAGNYQRAHKHLIIAAKAGDNIALGIVKKGFMKGFISKDEYANTLRAYHERQKETRSDMRDKAAAHIQPLRIDT